jgi:hypothetical protein
MAEQAVYKPLYTKSHALVIGINSYSDPRFAPLGQAEDDARAVAEVLAADPYNFNVTTLIGHDATRQAILGALFKLRKAQEDERILVYFAGHGYTLSDRLGQEMGYLAAVDTVPEQDFTALEMEEVTELARYAPAKHVAFIFDACFSGQALGLTRSASVTADKLLTRRAYQVISAGAGDQTVADFQSMTSRMLEVLEQRARITTDGLLTINELGIWLQQTIAADSGQTQIPQFGHIRGSQGGDMVLYQDLTMRLPMEIEEALASDTPNLRLGAVVALIDLLAINPDIVEIGESRLRLIAKEDTSEKVRVAAESYFLEQAAKGSGKPLPLVQLRRARQFGDQSTTATGTVRRARANLRAKISGVVGRRGLDVRSPLMWVIAPITAALIIGGVLLAINFLRPQPPVVAEDPTPTHIRSFDPTPTHLPTHTPLPPTATETLPPPTDTPGAGTPTATLEPSATPIPPSASTPSAAP